MGWHREHKVKPFETKEVDFSESTFRGFSAGIGNEDSYDDIIEPGAFDKSIEERVAAGKVKFLNGHMSRSTRDLWGDVIEAAEVKAPAGHPDGPTHLLDTLFRVSKSDPDAQVALGKIDEGILDALSIGFVPVEVRFELRDEDDDRDPVVAWLFGDAIRYLSEIAWWETSAVVWGANAAAIIPGKVHDVLTSAAKATREGAVCSDEARDTLVRMKSLMVDARENPAAFRAMGYKADDLARNLEPFVECADGVCTLNDAGKAAAHLFDGIREAVQDSAPKGFKQFAPGDLDTATVTIVDPTDVKVVGGEDEDDCGCSKSADDAEITDSEGGDPDTPGPVSMESFQRLRADVVALWERYDALDERTKGATTKDADATDDAVAGPGSDDSDGPDERREDAGDDADDTVAGDERASTDPSDERQHTSDVDLDRELAELELIDIEINL